MQIEDYMGYYLPVSGEPLREAEAWRKSFAGHHARLMSLMKSVEGCTGAKFDQVNGKVLGLVFDEDSDLPPGWRWENARKEWAVPYLTSQKIVDMAAARRHRDALDNVGTYEPQHEVARRLGFILDYQYEGIGKNDGRVKGSSSIGPIGAWAQLVFLGNDGPLVFFAPDARKVHELFVQENVVEGGFYGGPEDFKCANGADVWVVPEGLERISKAQWEFMAAEYRLKMEHEHGQS